VEGFNSGVKSVKTEVTGYKTLLTEHSLYLILWYLRKTHTCVGHNAEIHPKFCSDMISHASQKIVYLTICICVIYMYCTVKTSIKETQDE
jgi:hypothetical protein